jgi:hypothetical protein
VGQFEERTWWKCGTGRAARCRPQAKVAAAVEEILWAYKRQPTIQKRLEQMNTDHEVAPVYLKELRRIQALWCVYFLALWVEARLERELRQAMEREALESLPLYPEGRPCRCSTTRRLLDVFQSIERHTLLADEEQPEVLVTELSDLQRKLVKLPVTVHGDCRDFRGTRRENGTAPSAQRGQAHFSAPEIAEK